MFSKICHQYDCASTSLCAYLSKDESWDCKVGCKHERLQFFPFEFKEGGGGEPVQEVLVRSDGRVIDGVTRVCWFQLDLGWVHEKRRISPG